MSTIRGLIFVSVISIALARTGRLSPEEPYGIENHNLEIKVVDLKPPIKSCQILLKNSAVHYNINNASQFKDVHFIHDDTLGECGVLLSPAKNIHRGSWLFFVEDGDGMARKFTSSVTIQSLPPEPVYKHIRKPIGHPVDEACYPHGYLITYVKIYNPNNELVQEGSSKKLTINPLKSEHNGTWKCVLQLKGRLTEAHNSIFIEVIPNEPNDILKTETDTRVNLLYRSNFSPISACVCERPDGLGFSLIEGVHFGRYSYYGLGIRKGDCGVSIEKPLQDHDYGTWKCILPPTKLGGFIHIDKTPLDRNIKDIPVSTTTPVIKALEGSKIDMECYAKESLAYCYVKSPEGKIYWSTTGNGLLIGQCKVEVKVVQRDNGTWICGMGVQGYSAGYEDLQVPINVYVYEGPLIISKEPQAPVTVAGSTEIACRTALDVGVKYCLFTRPDGTHINTGSISENPYGKSSYIYNGEGLEKGDCSLLINPVTEKDIGSWKCHAGIASVLNKAPEYGITIKVFR